MIKPDPVLLFTPYCNSAHPSLSVEAKLEIIYKHFSFRIVNFVYPKIQYIIGEFVFKLFFELFKIQDSKFLSCSGKNIPESILTLSSVSIKSRLICQLILSLSILSASKHSITCAASNS